MKHNEKLFYNGDLLTLEEDTLYVEALLVKKGKIHKIGTKEALLKEASKEVELIDLQGKTLMPAFIDAHSHFSGYAISFIQVDLSEVTRFDEIKEAIRKFVIKNKVPSGTWIQADGYDQNALEEKKHPTKAFLDEIAPDHPLIIKHQSGHMGVLNSKGLEALAITVDTPSPEGGVIEKKDGQLTGYLEEAAFINYVQRIPIASEEELMACLRKADQAYSAYGITTAQEGFIGQPLVPILKGLMASNQLNIDLIGFLDVNDAHTLKKAFEECLLSYKNHVKIGGYKTFLDGSPQGRTAWMRTPYKEGPKDYYAYGTQKDEELVAKIEKSLEDEMQILVHCNGDAACEQYITQYEKCVQKTSHIKDRRPVMIHAQLLDRDQLPRVKALGMIPSFFVGHVYYWGDVHIKNYGLERASRISLAGSALKEGIPFTFHQDAPVIEPNMLETIWCAVNRITKEGVVLGEEERISPLEALKAVTIHGAYQYFEEHLKGSLKEGKWADLVILDQNILKVDPMEIRNIQVLETIKEGKSIYKKR